MHLAEIARRISRDRNYSIRAGETGGHGEVAVLVEAFNDMLSQIEVRDEALRKARDELEQRVEERTRQLVAANKELEAFSYSVSHDLRGPLEVIGGIHYLLESNYAEKLDAEANDYVQRIGQATQRMSQLIEDLLNLSRLSSSEIHREKLDLSSLARSIAAELCQSDPQRKVEFVIADCALVDGDARLLRIAMENLLGNSWKYTSHHEQARIEFGCEERNGARVYFVRDDGAGFDARHSGRLFGAFQRLHSQNRFPGTGIGLATVQRIIRRHGGEVWAEGAVEKGAIFYFRL
jgi:light-regulated signal transduction histidine kinase (bacteriophytochrome)